MRLLSQLNLVELTRLQLTDQYRNLTMSVTHILQVDNFEVCKKKFQSHNDNHFWPSFTYFALAVTFKSQHVK